MTPPRATLRSYRRACRRAYRPYPILPPTHPLMVEMGRRGDRLQRVFGYDPRRYPYDSDVAPVEVLDAMTSRDLESLARVDEDECPF